MEFKNGDRVKTNKNYGTGKIKGKIGTIIGLADEYYVVEFDEKFKNGHSGTHLATGKHGHCWQVRDYMIDLMKPLNTLLIQVGDKFKGKRVSVIQNGNTYKLTKTNGKVLYTYIPKQGISRIVSTSDKTEKMYIELFEQAIEEFNNAKE